MRRPGQWDLQQSHDSRLQPQTHAGQPWLSARATCLRASIKQAHDGRLITQHCRVTWRTIDWSYVYVYSCTSQSLQQRVLRAVASTASDGHNELVAMHMRALISIPTPQAAQVSQLAAALQGQQSQRLTAANRLDVTHVSKK